MSDREFTNINGIKVCDQTARNNIPTKTSQLENDNDYATITQVNQAINNAQLSGGGTGNINDTTASSNTTYSSNKIESIKEDLSSQINEIKNYSLVKHTDGLLYIKRQDGTLIGTGVEVGNNTDLSKITMSMEGQTLKLLNDGTQIATVEIPTAVVTDEQLTAIIQSKIDDGSLSQIEATIEDGSITPDKTSFLKEVTGIINTTFSGYGYLKYASDYIDITNIDTLYFATKPQSNCYSNYNLITYNNSQTIVDSEYSLEGVLRKRHNSNLEEVLYGHVDCIPLKEKGVQFVKLVQNEKIMEGTTRLVAGSPIDVDTWTVPQAVQVDAGVADGLKTAIAIDIDDTKFVSYEASLIDFGIYTNSGYSGELFDQAGSNQNIFLDYVDVSTNKDLYLRLYGHGHAKVSEYVRTLCYDANKTFLRRLEPSEWQLVRGQNTTTVTSTSTTQYGNINGVIYGDRSVQKIHLDDDVKFIRIAISNNYSGMASMLNKASAYSAISYEDITDFDALPEKLKLIVGDKFKQAVNKSLEDNSRKPEMVMIGDSLTNWGGGSTTENGFLKIVSDKTGVLTHNRGLAGAWWQTGDGQEQCGVNRVDYIIANNEKFDIYCFMLGTNAGSTTDTGETSSDTTTMCGAIRYCMEKLKAYDPEGQILVCLPPQRSEGSNENQLKVNEVIKKIVENEYSVRTLDIFRHSGIVPNTTIQGINYLPDGLHLGERGKTALGKTLAAEIKYMLCL